MATLIIVGVVLAASVIAGGTATGLNLSMDHNKYDPKPVGQIAAIALCILGAPLFAVTLPISFVADCLSIEPHDTASKVADFFGSYCERYMDWFFEAVQDDLGFNYNYVSG